MPKRQRSGGSCTIISVVGMALIGAMVAASYRLQSTLLCFAPSPSADTLQVAKVANTVDDPIKTNNKGGGSSIEDANVQPSWEALRERYAYIEATPRDGERHPSCSRNAHGKWDFFSLNLTQQSRLKEDEDIFNYFFHDFNGHGTYIELGAFDGHAASNTRFYDECLGWEGLLIEANPIKKNMLIANRPHADKIFYAPSCINHNETVKFPPIQSTNASQVGRVLSNEGGKTKHVDVPCGPLSPVLENVFPHRRVNFFSLHAAGVEPLVLETIDFTKFQFDVVIIDNFNNHCQVDCDDSRDKIRKIMHEAGYLRFEEVILASDLYLHPSVGKRPPMLAASVAKPPLPSSATIAHNASSRKTLLNSISNTSAQHQRPGLRSTNSNTTVKEHTTNKTRNIDWNWYRIGDAVKGWKYDKMNASNPSAACQNFPDTIICDYLSSKTKENDIQTLDKVVANRTTSSDTLFVLPDPSDIVVHLRLGDGLCAPNDCKLDPKRGTPDCWLNDFDCFQFLENRYAYSKSFYLPVMKQLKQQVLNRFHNTSFSKLRVQVVSDSTHWTRSKDPRRGNFSHDDLYRQHFQEFLLSHEFVGEVIMRNHDEFSTPDEDFIYLCGAHTYVQGGGGYSRLVAAVIEERGGAVLVPTDERKAV